MDSEVDVVIVGAGSGGLAALREVRKHTERFLIVNDGPYGTVCARVGCMPSKLLIEAAEAFHRRTTFDTFGIRGAGGLQVDIPAVLRRVRRLRDDFVNSTLKATDAVGERNVAERATLLGPNKLRVGDREVRARAIVLATGSSPAVPEAWSSFRERVFTTDTLFEQPDLPRRMAVIGGGPVGVELAQALARLGVRISLFGSREAPAGISDPEVAESVRQMLAAEMDLRLGTRAEVFEQGDRLVVRAGDAEVQVDAVLAAAGRPPNVHGLGLETLGVPLDKGGLPKVDPCTTRVGELPVFLAGDVDRYRPLLHEAADDGHIAGLNAVAVAQGRAPRAFERRVALGIAFTNPNVASVGTRFGDLDPQRSLVSSVRFERHGRARMAQINQGLLRVYCETETGRLLGSEMFAPAGEHMAHLLALAIERKLTVHDMLRMPIYHPTLEEGLRTALRRLASQLPRSTDSDLNLADCPPYGIEALE